MPLLNTINAELGPLGYLNLTNVVEGKIKLLREMGGTIRAKL